MLAIKELVINEHDNLVRIYSKFQIENDKAKRKNANAILPYLYDLQLDSFEALNLMKTYLSYT